MSGFRTLLLRKRPIRQPPEAEMSGVRCCGCDFNVGGAYLHVVRLFLETQNQALYLRVV